MLQFSLTNLPFLQYVSFSTFRSLLFTIACRCFDSDTDSESDCELADLEPIVTDWQMERLCFYSCVFMFLLKLRKYF